jgi:hypothetical protein
MTETKINVKFRSQLALQGASDRQIKSLHPIHFRISGWLPLETQIHLELYEVSRDDG